MSRPKVVRRTRPSSPDMQLGPWVVLPSHQDFTFPQNCVHSVAPTQRPFHSAINTHAVITPSFQSSLERKGNHTGWAEIRLSITMKLSATSKGWAFGKYNLSQLCGSCHYLHVTQTQSSGGRPAPLRIGSLHGRKWKSSISCGTRPWVPGHTWTSAARVCAHHQHLHPRGALCFPS